MGLQLNVYQVNANSVFNKRHLFDAILRDFKQKEIPIIFIINDTRLTPGLNLNFNFPGYNTIRFDIFSIFRWLGLYIIN